MGSVDLTAAGGLEPADRPYEEQMMKLKTLFVAAGLIAAALVNAADLKWAKDYNTAMSTAKKAKKVVMIDFTAVWCTNCHKLERTTYKDPSVVKLLANAVPVQVDYDKQPTIAKKYKAVALPVIVFLDSTGKELGRVTGYKNAADFVKAVKPILAKAK
jgi:thiol:disulfide interchange protein